MSKNLKWTLVLLGFVAPFLLIYKAFFLQGSLAFGDAPFFAPENLKELFNLPFLWNVRHDNFGSTQYHILWLYLPTYIYGVLNYVLGLGNDLLIRIVFYFPATVLAIIGSWQFIGRFNQNIWGRFLGSLLYGFNTYFLMLIDGGQVGVALSYGLFPIAAVSVLSYLKNLNIKNYLLALLALFALVSVDIRIALILILFVGVIGMVEGIRERRAEILKGASILGLSILGLSSYWIMPAVSSLRELGGLGELSSGTNFISLSNSLFLFQPHFPLNQFGKIVPTPFYFVLLLPLILGSLILKSKNYLQRKVILKFTLLFLFLAFFAKGGSEPFGMIYYWFVNLPGGVAFRDSSKFYIPLILTGGLLLSLTIDSLGKLTRRKMISGVIISGIYIYLLALIYPALFGNLSGALGGSGRIRENDYQKVTSYLQGDQGFGRSLWFEEKPSLFYGSWEKPALSANTLYKDRPFASMIVGKYDFFNYVYSPQFCQWLELLGIKYVLLPENERKKIVDEKEKRYRQELVSRVTENSCLSSSKTSTSFPVYQTSQNMPQIFAQKKAVLVVGGEGVYDRLVKDSNFTLSKQGFIFAEEGKTDLNTLSGLDPESLTILFYDKNLLDLQMGYFTKKMVSPGKAEKQQWKVYGSNDYLVWKYELLKNDINTREFDFGKGVALSSVAGEKIQFKLPTFGYGNYYLAVRFTNSLGGKVGVKTSGQEFKLMNENPDNFKWGLLGPVSVNENYLEVEVTNEGSFALLNVLALIPEDQFQGSGNQAKELMSRYKTVFLKSDQEDSGNWGDWGVSNTAAINYKQVNPTQYQLTNLPNKPGWIVFSDHFDPGWTFAESQSKVHVPLYSMINGFYFDGKSQELTLSYFPQGKVELSVKISLLSAGAIILISSGLLLKRRRFKR